MVVTVLVSGSADTQSLSISIESARSGIGTTLLYQSLKYITIKLIIILTTMHMY